MAGAGIGRDVDVCGRQEAQSMALAGRRARKPPHRGLGTRRPQPGHGPALVAATARPLARAALLVFHRPVGELRGGTAPLAAPPQPQRQRRHQHRGGHQLRLAPAVWGVGAQIVLVQ